MTSASNLKGRVALVHPLRYKLEGGWLWGLSGAEETFVKLFYADKEERVGIINQGFGENYVSFYAELGLKGHNGMDLYGKPGCGLYAVSDGVVHEVNDPLGDPTYNPNTWGYIQLLCEQNGIKFLYTYGHVNDVLVKRGQRVRANDLIALLGNTGKYTTGPHAHVQFQLLDKSNNILNFNNGYWGCLNDKDLYEDLIIYKSDDLKKLYNYANTNNVWYFGFGGGERFEIAKKKLGIVGVTRSQYYNYLIKNLFK